MKKQTNEIFLLILYLECGLAFGAVVSVTNIQQFCPLKCVCNEHFSMFCKQLSSPEIVDLFAENGNLTRYFANFLTNFTIQNSDIFDLTNLSKLTKFSKLLYIDLSKNKIKILASPVDFVLSTVTSLKINWNKLRSITRESFIMFPNVEEIYLEGNGIFTIDWEAFRLFQLKKLYLSNNHLAIINEHMLRFTPNLEHLDISYNQLTVAQSSSFFAAQHLSHIDLSFNRIQRFHYDSFSPLFQLESFNLAFNNLSQIPPDLRQFIALRVLNISGNYFEKISVGELVQPVLQVLDISYCKILKLIEANAFTKLPNLQTAILSNNPMLNFISPYAFCAVKLLFDLHLSNNSLKTLDKEVFQLPIRLYIANNPFKCSCIAPIFQKFQKHVVDSNEATCLYGSKTLLISQAGQKKDLHDKFLSNLSAADYCSGGMPLVPFGTKLKADVGEYFSLYCAAMNPSDTIVWTFPNGTQYVVNSTESMQNDYQNASYGILTRMDNDLIDKSQAFFTSASLHFPHLKPQLKPHFLIAESHDALLPANQQVNFILQKRSRILVTREQMRFEIITEKDSGKYRCQVMPSQIEKNWNASKYTTKKVLLLTVCQPKISINVMEVGSHYASLAWNDSLKIKAIDKVALSLDVRDANNQLSRSIQLSLHNPWYSYNVMRLKPLTNYTFCLVYRLLEYEDRHKQMSRSKFGIASFFAEKTIHFVPQSRSLLFETCVDAQTFESLNFWNSLSASTIVTLGVFAFCIAALLTFRALYFRFFIWHETKLRARMNESISGQRFLSNSSSIQNSFGVMSQSITFENNVQTIIILWLILAFASINKYEQVFKHQF